MQSGPQPLALVITELEPGGAERAFTQLALRIDRAKFLPHVFSLQPRPREEKCDLVNQLAAADVPVEFLNARSKWQFASAVWKLSRRLRTLRPAIAQSFLFHANVVTALAGKLAGVKVVAGIRVADPSRARQRAERWWIEPLVQKFVCVSQSVADFSANTARLPRAKLCVVPNGVDVAKFADAAPADAAALGLPSQQRFFICIGRLDKQKGFDWLLPLLPRIFAERPSHDLLIVGDGPERTSLQQQAGELGIANRVHFLGWQPQVAGLLKLADVLLLPSRWEGMPNVLLEAMAAGLPVVSTNVEGAAEILGPLAEKQLTQQNDAAAFQNATLALASEPTAASRLGELNQQRVREQFSLALLASAYETIYSQIIHS
ncbi:glycosyltransferase [Anatilimnocola floriformis]|uniref:glycosyltransferase n=1 Tax=Anatilimnocola floriformis TaxID=2948575 RepID=UPI0020C3985B|nr:glycosyltransferase [Anatilimnocola floriformis]